MYIAVAFTQKKVTVGKHSGYSCMLQMNLTRVTHVAEFVLVDCPTATVRVSFNLLSPKSDQHQISPCNSNALKNRVVMRITDMITQDQFT